MLSFSHLSLTRFVISLSLSLSHSPFVESRDHLRDDGDDEVVKDGEDDG